MSACDIVVCVHGGYLVRPRVEGDAMRRLVEWKELDEVTRCFGASISSIGEIIVAYKSNKI